MLAAVEQTFKQKRCFVAFAVSRPQNHANRVVHKQSDFRRGRETANV
jgi:hypothetical protein